MNIISFPSTIKTFYVNMTGFIPVLSLFLLGLFYLGTFLSCTEKFCAFFKSRADIAAKTHNRELELESCWVDHHHLQKGHDDFLLVISQVQRGPCLFSLKYLC